MAPFIILVGTAVLYLLEPKLRALQIPEWRHRHARVNLSAAVLNLLVLAGIGLSTSMFLDRATSGAVGLNKVLVGSNLAAPVIVIILVLLYDYVNYWIHRSQHVISPLWPLHRIHHSDPYLDVTSAFRFHPFESLYRATIQSATIVAFGMTPEMVALYLAIVSSVLLFSHSNIKLPDGVDRVISLLIVTPDVHRVHHSNERRFHDSNYGIAFSIWDRIHRTFTPPRHVENLRIGHDQYPEAQNLGLIDILRDPFRR